MIERQIVASRAAVLAGVIVASEDVLAVERHALADGATYVPAQSNDARNTYHACGRAQHAIVIKDALGDLLHEQGDGAFDGADVQRFKAGVENQNPGRSKVGERCAGFVGVKVRVRRKNFLPNAPELSLGVWRMFACCGQPVVPELFGDAPPTRAS